MLRVTGIKFVDFEEFTTSDVAESIKKEVIVLKKEHWGQELSFERIGIESSSGQRLITIKYSYSVKQC
ncbi:MAG: hypothetical protein ACFFD4_04480 [Candidatus Odinarchaeota archaeon]